MTGKKPGLRKLIKKLDDVFSLYIRNKYAKDDLVKCFTCFQSKPIKEMQAGHYVSRSHMNTRYDEQNVHPQCIQCNIFKKGNMDAYAINLLKTYGISILEELNKRKWQSRKFTAREMELLIQKYGDLQKTR